MDTLGSLLATAVAGEPTRPLLTYYDDGTGERTELSGTTLANWVAKTANLLVEGVGADPGDRALVLLPPHWQTAAVLLGCWSAGLAVTPQPPAEVAFASLARAGEITVGERYLLGLHPLALPLPPGALPPGYADFATEVRTQADRFVAVFPIDPDGPADPVHSQRELRAAATRRAAELGIGPGDRVLVDAAAHPEPLDWLLAPLAAGASIVLCGQLDPGRLAQRVATERVTVQLT
jgi:uncharacterized protein (TIGR03089 family)